MRVKRVYKTGGNLNKTILGNGMSSVNDTSENRINYRKPRIPTKEESERSQEQGMSIIKAADPTGISNYPDLYRAIKSGEADKIFMETMASLPMVGKAGKAVQAAELALKTKRGVPLLKIARTYGSGMSTANSLSGDQLYATGGQLGMGTQVQPKGTTDYDSVPSYLYYLKAAKENNQEGMNKALAHITGVRGSETATNLQFLGKNMQTSDLNSIAKRSVAGEKDPQMKLLYSHLNDNPDALDKFEFSLPNQTDIAAKKFAFGGDITDEQRAITGGAVTGLTAIGGLADALDTPNEYGRQSTGTTMLKSAATFAGVGSTFGPVGAGIGAGVGALVGMFKGNAEAKREEIAKKALITQKEKASRVAGTALVSADPRLVSGYEGAGYYRNGGDLTNLKRVLSTKGRQFGTGGSLQRLSTDTELVKGPSHEEGGVKLPGNNEVEGGETIKDGFVFSEALGFAKLHKPIAKKIGIIENKAPTAERLTSLKRLRDQENSLALLQEQYKEQNNVG